MDSHTTVLTVGHSNHTIEQFLSLLVVNKVSAIADVRSAPFSRYSPQFNRNELNRSLKEIGIDYVFLGRELGARSDDRSCYIDHRVQYNLLSQTTEFKRGVDRVLRGAAQQRVAMLCTEKDPLDCHRTILISRELTQSGVAVDHILADGSVESQDEAMSRLLAKFGLGDGDLFHSRTELLEEALTRQESEIAYVEPAQLTSSTEDPS